jgi:phosphoglycolate phosphatase
MMTSSKAPVLLWDIDGTLLYNDVRGLGPYFDAIARVAPDVPVPEIVTHGKTDWQVICELLEAANLDIGLAEAVSEQLDEVSRSYLEPEGALTLLPFVTEALGAFSDAGLRNGLLTGNSIRRSRMKLTGAGLDETLIDWDAGFFGSRTRVRSDLSHAARARFEGVPMLLIGDTPLDGHAAQKAGIPFAAVCTGVYDASAFDGEDCVLVLENLKDSRDRILSAIMELLPNT